MSMCILVGHLSKRGLGDLFISPLKKDSMFCESENIWLSISIGGEPNIVVHSYIPSAAVSSSCILLVGHPSTSGCNGRFRSVAMCSVECQAQTVVWSTAVLFLLFLQLCFPRFQVLSAGWFISSYPFSYPTAVYQCGKGSFGTECVWFSWIHTVRETVL